MLVLSLVIFLLTLLLTFGFRTKRGYDDKHVSREIALCVPSLLAGIFFGLAWVNVFLGIFIGAVAFISALLLGEECARAGRALRDGGVSRASNPTLFAEAGSRLRKLIGRGEQREATWRVGEFFGDLPGDAQFDVLKGTYNQDWTAPLANELAAQLRVALDWIFSGEGEQVTEENSYGRPDAMKRLTVQLLPLLAQHPLLAEMLREQENTLAGQASSLQLEVDVLAAAHNTYTQKTGVLEVITRRSKEIARLLNNDAPEEAQEQ